MSQTSPNNEGATSRAMTIKNKHGMHARPAALLIKMAGQFKSEIVIEKDGTKVSACSIMGLLTLELYHGTEITVHAEGPDSCQALDAIEDLVNRKFDEE